MEPPHEEVSKTDARAGDGRKANRAVMAVSLLLVIIAFATLLFVYG